MSPHDRVHSRQPHHQRRLTSAWLAHLLLLGSLACHSHAAPPAAAAAASPAAQPWQAGVLCSSTGGSTAAAATAPTPKCADQHAGLLARWGGPALANASAFPTVAGNSGSASFVVLARHLRPAESNVQFAQAFCLSRSGQLAYWSSDAELAQLSRLVFSAAKQIGGNAGLHAYVGIAQTPGAAEPAGGWVWLHSGAPAAAGGGTQAGAAAVAWADGEPNQHNGAVHTEDCAVIATYHGEKASPRLVDDFPCSYQDQKTGKWSFGNTNPRLTVACRLQ